MQIKKQDKKQGLIEVIPESLDDLWHLSHIIQPGDYITTLTTRRIQDNNSGKTRSDRGVKKTFYLSIRVEKISFHKYTGMLRLTGIIESGPEDLIPLGSYHTINVQINHPIQIRNTWNKWALDRLNEAIEASKRAPEIIVAIEDNITELGIIKQYGIDYIGPIIGDISGKRNIQKNRKEKIDEYYQQITDTILKHNNLNKLIIIGPGFTKNGYYEYLTDHYPEIAKKSILESTGAGGHAGIQEGLKIGLIESLSKDAKIAKENGWLYHFVCFLFCHLSFAGICPDVFASFNRNAFPLRSEFTGLAYGICPTPGSWYVRHPGLGMSDIRVLVCLTPGCQTRCSCIRGYV